MPRKPGHLVEYLEAIAIAVVVAVVLRWFFPALVGRGPGPTFWMGLAGALVLTASVVQRRRRRR